MSNMFDAIKMLGKMNELKGKMNQVREKLAGMMIEEWSDDRMIKVTVSGDKKISEIHIHENLFYPAAKQDLENRLVATLNSAFVKAENTSKEELKKEMEGILPDIPGLDLGNLPF